MPSREIICADALQWMRGPIAPGSVVTSLPDAEEIGLDHAAWADWFRRGAYYAMRLARPDSPAIFYQTDRKAKGALLSKPFLLMQAAEHAGMRLLWHKIVMRREPGKVDIHRPGYSHLMAFSEKGKPGAASPDIIARGQMVYPNAMGLIAARFACSFAGASCGRIIDPFCGRGSIPAMANALGFSALGCDIDPAQCEHARKLAVPAAAPVEIAWDED